MFRIVEKTIDPETHHAKLMVEIEPEAMERFKRRVARKLSKAYRIPGFRPGKAPYGMVVRHLGESLVRETLLEDVLDELYSQFLAEAEIEAAMPGTLKKVHSWDPLRMEFEIPLKPEVDLGDYRNLRVPYEPPQVTEEDIERALENLRRMHVRMESVDRAAQVGDMVYLRLQGKYTTPDGQVHEIPAEEVSLLVKEEEEEDEWPFPGFSRQLAGLKKGDTQSLRYTYPENSSMAGYVFEYQVEVLDVQSPVYPEITDEFIQEVTEHASVEEFRESVRKNLKQERERMYEQEYMEKVVEALLNQARVVYPARMLEEEIQRDLERLEERLAEQNLTLEEYLKAREMSKEELIDKEIRPRAEKRLKEQLVIEALVKEEDIQLDEEESKQAVLQAASDLIMEAGSEKEARRLMSQHPRLFEELMLGQMYLQVYRKALEHLTRIARGELEQTQEGPSQDEEAAQAPGAPSEAAMQAPSQPETETSLVSMQEESQQPETPIEQAQ